MLIAASLGLVTASARAVPTESDAPEAAAPGKEGPSADELAKMLANPVANLWSLTFQYNNFEHEPAPAADMAPEAVAFHRFAIERLSRTVMAGTDKNIAERR